jgi:hypothetical protein
MDSEPFSLMKRTLLKLLCDVCSIDTARHEH